VRQWIWVIPLQLGRGNPGRLAEYPDASAGLDCFFPLANLIDGATER